MTCCIVSTRWAELARTHKWWIQYEKLFVRRGGRVGKWDRFRYVACCEMSWPVFWVTRKYKMLVVHHIRACWDNNNYYRPHRGNGAKTLITNSIFFLLALGNLVLGRMRLVRRKIHADCKEPLWPSLFRRLTGLPWLVLLDLLVARLRDMLSGSRHLTNRYVSCVSAYG